MEASQDSYAALKADFDRLKAIVDRIDATPAPGYSQRPAATGSNPNAGAQTDC